MKKYAEVVDGKVHCLVEFSDDFTPMYDKRKMTMVKITNTEPNPGDRWDGNKFISKPPKPDNSKELRMSKKIHTKLIELATKALKDEGDKDFESDS